jgi:tetratricopeptide (TPR) repeat protein
MTNRFRAVSAAAILGLGAFGVYLCCRSASAAPALLTENDGVVLADFDNKTGESVFDYSLKEALVLELGQSPFLNVTSDRKISEALRASGRPAHERITMNSGLNLCLRAGSKAMLGGTISRVNGEYLVDLTAVACDTGNTLAQARGAVAGKEGVLKALSQASLHLRSSLGEPLASVQKFDVPVAAITTSLEALNSYSEGTAVRREQSDGPSIPFLKRAIELDPNFPLAYATLAAIYRNLREPSRALEYATKAYQLRTPVSEREKLHLASTYFLVTGEVDKEIPIYEQWVTNYPRDFLPHNNLGNDYAALGQLDEALVEYQEALRLMPSVVAYTNVVGMDITLHRLHDAEAVFKEAFASNFDGGYLHQNLYWLAFLRGDAALMQKQVAWASGKAGDEDALLSIQSDTEAFSGQLTQARADTERAVKSAVCAGSKETAALWQVNGALREAELGNAGPAGQGIVAALALSSGRDVKVMSALAMARTSDTARAEALLVELKNTYATDTLLKRYWLPTIRASIELSTGDSSKALQSLKAAEHYEMGNAGTFISYLYPAYVRGEAYLLAHSGKAAATEFQKLLDHSGIVSNFVTGALVHLQLARAYTMSGDAGKAKTEYENFLSIWENADSDMVLLTQAKAEYAKLFRKT